MFKSALDVNSRTVRIIVDDQPVDAFEDEMVAGVLARMEPPFSRTNPVSGDRRAPYCMMGVCFECLIRIDGVASVQSCLTPVRNGMVVERQIGSRGVI